LVRTFAGSLFINFTGKLKSDSESNLIKKWNHMLVSSKAGPSKNSNLNHRSDKSFNKLVSSEAGPS